MLGKVIAAEKFVAVGAVDAHDMIIALDHRIQRPARPTIGIAQQDQVKALRPFIQAFFHRRRNLFGPIMQLRRHRRQLEVPALPFGNSDHFPNNRTTGDNADFHKEFL